MTVGPLMVQCWRAALMQPGMTKRGLSMWCAQSGEWRFIRRAIDRSIDAGLLTAADGPNHAKLIYAVPIADLDIEAATGLAAYFTRQGESVPPLLHNRIRELDHDELRGPARLGADPVAGRPRHLSAVPDVARGAAKRVPRAAPAAPDAFG